MAGSRRHSVSGDPYGSQKDYGSIYGSAYGYPSRSSTRGRRRYPDADVDDRVYGSVPPPYMRDSDDHHSSSMPKPRTHSHDRGSRRRDRRERHRSLDPYRTDDYNPRDRLYLNDDEDRGRDRRSKHPSQHPRDPRRAVFVDDYLNDGRRHSEPVNKRHSSAAAGAPPSPRSRRSHRSRSPPPREVDSARPTTHRRHSSLPAPSDRRRGHSPSRDRDSHHHHRHASSSHHRSSPQRSSKFSFSRSGSSRRKGDRRSSPSSPGEQQPAETDNFDWTTAARCAFEAGTLAALRVHDKPGSWVGTKGAQIATAALGAAVVDGIIAQKNPKMKGGKRHAVLRQVTTAALGNLVINPAGKQVEKKQPLRHVHQHLPKRMPIR